ncbi:hypothetical protein [Pontibacter sp. H249]|uniref:hypothetical protein n=1 Tax=Pontibacter sp. H249 TaxID=3133420 RepID=UPI0030BC5455
MSMKNGVSRVEVRLLPQLERELKEKAAAENQTINAFLRPYLWAIAKGKIHLAAVVDNEKLLPKKACNSCCHE